MTTSMNSLKGNSANVDMLIKLAFYCGGGKLVIVIQAFSLQHFCFFMAIILPLVELKLFDAHNKIIENRFGIKEGGAFLSKQKKEVSWIGFID